jgi:hypothetical protein
MRLKMAATWTNRRRQPKAGSNALMIDVFHLPLLLLLLPLLDAPSMASLGVLKPRPTFL